MERNPGANVTRGELYRVHKPGGDPKEYRTFVVASRQALIDSRFSTVVCAPVFSNGQGLSTQVAVGADEGMKHPSWIMCDNLVSLRKMDLRQYIGALSALKLAEFNQALRMALDL
ncbi:MAG: type II toxin-antitoxin system PemK/MazF family toxin [Candidatus Acidiferrales bacterium]